MSSPEAFQAEPSFLRGYADQIDRNTGFVGRVHDYLAQYAGKTDQMQFLLKPMAEACTSLQRWQTTTLATMQQDLQQTAAALAATANSYQHTDTANAQRMDQIYPSAAADRTTGPKPQ